MSFEDQEPNAELRSFASTMRGMYVALVKEGFGTDDALRIISEVIKASMPGNGKP